jgi:hypothetical protein
MLQNKKQTYFCLSNQTDELDQISNKSNFDKVSVLGPGITCYFDMQT